MLKKAMAAMAAMGMMAPGAGAWAQEPVRLVALSEVSYKRPGPVAFKNANGKDACQYVGEAKWERAPQPAGLSWALLADGGRRGVFRVSAQLSKRVCPDGSSGPSRFEARFGEVMVDTQEGRSFPAGSIALADAEAFALANRGLDKAVAAARRPGG